MLAPGAVIPPRPSSAPPSPPPGASGITLQTDVPVVPVKKLPVGPASGMSAKKDLTDILKEIVEHRLRYPTHGINCSCMDQVCWDLRKQIRDAVPRAFTYDLSVVEKEATLSLKHVLEMITRTL